MTATSLVEELQSAVGLSESDRGAWSLYERWCVAQALEPLRAPDDALSPEMCLLLFLEAHSRARDVCHAVLRSLACGIARVYERNGRDDPRGDSTRDYLAQARTRVGARRERQTDTLTLDQVRGVVATRAGFPRVPSIPLLQAIAALMDIGALEVSGAVVRFLRNATLRDFEVVADQVIFRAGPLQLRISQRDQPRHWHALMVVLEDAHDDAYLLRAPGSSSHTLKRLKSSLKRSNGTRGGAWIDHVDPEHARATQMCAYLLLGVFTGHRHAELSRLRLGMLRESPDGYAYVLKDHKGARLAAQRGGQSIPWRVQLPHQRRGADCISACPACALDRQLAERRLQGAGPQDLVFVASDGHSPFRVGVAIQGVKRAWRSSADETEHGECAFMPKLGTRTLRVTAATLALQHGMSLLDIADLLHHRSAQTTLLYIRRLNEKAVEEFTLPL